MADSDKNGQSAEDEEKRQRDAILRQAMMADLSINRVEELPLEDVDPPPPRASRHDGPAPDRGHGNTRLSMPQAPPDKSSIWAEAHRMGLFDDDDARAVRELDDLGGGRIYATRQQEVSALGTRLVHGIRERYVSFPSIQNCAYARCQTDADVFLTVLECNTPSSIATLLDITMVADARYPRTERSDLERT